MIDINNYYDSNTCKFKYESAEEELKEQLYKCLPEILLKINELFKMETNHLAEKMGRVNIIFEPEAEKQSPYLIDINKLVSKFEKEEYSCDLARGFAEEYRAREKTGMYYCDEWVRERIKSIKYLIEEAAESDFSCFPDKICYLLCYLIDQYLDGKEYMPGEFCEPGDYIKTYDICFDNQSPTIILYLKTICKNKFINDYLLEVFAHELFHVYHWMNAERYFWHDELFEAIKEGLASYVEIEYIRGINKELAENLIKKLNNRFPFFYPHSFYNELKNKENEYLTAFKIGLTNCSANDYYMYRDYIYYYFEMDSDFKKYEIIVEE